MCGRTFWFVLYYLLTILPDYSMSLHDFSSWLVLFTVIGLLLLLDDAFWSTFSSGHSSSIYCGISACYFGFFYSALDPTCIQKLCRYKVDGHDVTPEWKDAPTADSYRPSYNIGPTIFTSVSFSHIDFYYI